MDGPVGQGVGASVPRDPQWRGGEVTAAGNRGAGRRHHRERRFQHPGDRRGAARCLGGLGGDAWRRRRASHQSPDGHHRRPGGGGQIVQRARDEGRNVAEYVGQTDMFSGRAVSPETEAVLRIFFRGQQFDKPRGREKIVDALRWYVEQARQTTPDRDIFGAEPIGPGQILEGVRERFRREEADKRPADLFARPRDTEAAAGGGVAPGGQEGQRPERAQGGEEAGGDRPGGTPKEEVAPDESDAAPAGQAEPLEESGPEKSPNFTKDTAGQSDQGVLAKAGLEVAARKAGVEITLPEASTETVAPTSAEQESREPKFPVGTRVVIGGDGPYAGRHGEVVKADVFAFQDAEGGNKSYTHSYKITRTAIR